MSENVSTKLLEKLLRAMHARFDRLEHMVREQGAAAAEDRAHLRTLMQTTGRHDDGFAHLYLRPRTDRAQAGPAGRVTGASQPP